MEKKMTMSQAVQMIVEQLDGPITEDELARRVFEIYITTAKTARSSLRNAIRYDHDGKTLIWLGKDKIILVRKFMPGIRFHIPVDARLAHACILTLDMFEPFYARTRGGKASLTFLDEKGKPLPARMKTVKMSAPKDLARIIGNYDAEGYNLQEWAEAHDIHKGDSILVTIRDWEHSVYSLEHEPAGKRQRVKIKAANKEFADTLFGILEASYDDRPIAFQIIPKVYASLPNPYDYPGDHWTQVIEKDGRMSYNGWMITYAEEMGLFDRIGLEPGERLPYVKDKYARGQAGQVFRFKAEAGFNKKVWREIEIKSNQRLADLDQILREAFQLDSMDHLGGFWKLIPRGTTKRVREVEIGDVDPMGEGSAADLHVGGLELKPGDRMKYVYDFGDWIEHFLTLEEISTAEKGAEYPRIVGQNKPRYRYCQVCAEKDKKTIATIICIDCSNRKEKDILVCDTCKTTFEAKTGDGIKGACVDYPKASIRYEIKNDDLAMKKADLAVAYQNTIEPGWP